MTPPLTNERSQGSARQGSAGPPRPPVAYDNVYVDDFILVALTKHQQQLVWRAVLHSIDALLCPLEMQDRVFRKEPVSVKKLKHGDACWMARETVLACDVDTVAGTALTLPPQH